MASKLLANNKESTHGKIADYRHIFSDNSYKKHWARAQKFADFCRENNIKKMEDITPNFAQKYLLYERDQHVNGYQGYFLLQLSDQML